MQVFVEIAEPKSDESRALMEKIEARAKNMTPKMNQIRSTFLSSISSGWLNFNERALRVVR
jgi:hypothetical protein